ncbi:hypothetical protein ABZ848_21885 [Streptomyces sp. NPDC047081]|uniref:hypothetical protein n=1 Tax=Streptomyces sp. NPDC047081 TaxID=3154706 RepID=UPI003408AEAB
MRRARWSVGGAAVVGVLLVGGWWIAYGDQGHPFGDERACAGSDVPLEQALDGVRLGLPAGAEDVHYVTHATAPEGGVRVAVAFRSTRRAMRTYLSENRIVTKELDSLDDGRFENGDVGADPKTLGLCGGVPVILGPAAGIEKKVDLGGAEQYVDIALQLSDGFPGSIRTPTDVLITVRNAPLWG